MDKNHSDAREAILTPLIIIQTGTVKNHSNVTADEVRCNRRYYKQSRNHKGTIKAQPVNTEAVKGTIPNNKSQTFLSQ